MPTSKLRCPSMLCIEAVHAFFEPRLGLSETHFLNQGWGLVKHMDFLEEDSPFLVHCLEVEAKGKDV